MHLNGRIVPLAAAKVSVFDRGFLFGDGVYETIRAYQGRPFRTKEHIRRLSKSARRLSMRVTGGVSAFVKGVAQTLAANRLTEARVRIVVTRGVGMPDLTDVAGTRPTVLIYATPYTPPSEKAYRDGVRAVIPQTIRNERRALDPAIKSINLLNNFLAIQEARRAGAREAILLNPRGMVAEAALANVFFVRRGVLCTPALHTGVLAGITRGLVIDLARRLGIPVQEGLFRLPALVRAEEVFVTGSTIEILPIAALGTRRYPRSRPYTRALQEAYRITVKDELGLADSPRQ